MDVQTVVTGLRRTIAGKEMLLATYENTGVNPYPAAVKSAMIAFLKLNIEELGKILSDLEEATK
jgi:hypothetical protein